MVTIPSTKSSKARSMTIGYHRLDGKRPRVTSATRCVSQHEPALFRMQRLKHLVAVSAYPSQRYRQLATVIPEINIVKPPPSPSPQPNLSLLDSSLLSKAEELGFKDNRLKDLLEQYENNRGRELPVLLNAEYRPTTARRVETSSNICPIFLVAHIARKSSEFKVSLSSGFKIKSQDDQEYVISCAHTLEEFRFTNILDSPVTQSTSLILSDNGSITHTEELVSCLPTRDLLMLRSNSSQLVGGPSLPISPYPAQKGTEIAAHLVTDKRPDEEGWTPCFGGLLYRKWVRGLIAGYRDMAGNEAKPGTYDTLAHMFFTPVPTMGSSGGPVIDIESGAVVGLIRGSRLDNRIAGLRGWATTSESIFEMFALPGLELK